MTAALFTIGQVCFEAVVSSFRVNSPKQNSPCSSSNLTTPSHVAGIRTSACNTSTCPVLTLAFKSIFTPLFRLSRSLSKIGLVFCLDLSATKATSIVRSRAAYPRSASYFTTQTLASSSSQFTCAEA